MHVQIVLFDGFDLLDAIAPYEVFCERGWLLVHLSCTSNHPLFLFLMGILMM
ncbi:hypothetical protein [Paenibacillus germinis]|uniref:hypothetical protein n=1 Tax=Paenibacillus germinis TaxID=2654979 RepID=UPI0014909E2D|nr:hypothetical protein [Paenibacillus germinis]